MSKSKQRSGNEQGGGLHSEKFQRTHAQYKKLRADMWITPQKTERALTMCMTLLMDWTFSIFFTSATGRETVFEQKQIGIMKPIGSVLGSPTCLIHA